MQPPASPGVTTHARATLFTAFRFAWQGILHVVRTQRNARIHLAVGTLVVIVAFWLHVAELEFAVLLVCITAVIAAEMMNTVVEATVDLISPEYHPLAKIAKDVAAGAVLVCAAGSAVIGTIVLAPHIWHILGR